MSLTLEEMLAGYATDLVQDSRRKVMSGQCSAEKSLVLTLMRMLLSDIISSYSLITRATFRKITL